MHDQDSTGGKATGKDPIKAQIDENLKRVYQAALVEEVPDRFKLLLEQLRAKEIGK
jgi:Anti-sigma factor NepR